MTRLPLRLGLLLLLLPAGGCGPRSSGGSLCRVPPGRHDLWGYACHGDARYDYVVFVRAPSPDPPRSVGVGTDCFWFGDSEEAPTFRVDFDPSWWGSVRIGRKSYWLPNGRVFLCDATGARTTVRQLRTRLPRAGEGPNDPDVGEHLARTNRQVASVLHAGGPTEPPAAIE